MTCTVNQIREKSDSQDTLCCQESQVRWSSLLLAYRVLGRAASRGALTYSKACVEAAK